MTNKNDYLVTRQADGSYTVWNTDQAEPYHVTFNPPTCNCPHWQFRLKRGRCKHHDIAEQQAPWLEVRV